MTDPLSPSARKVQDTLNALGFGTRQVVELPDSTRTAAEAAAAIGCTVAQIAKSLVFKGRISARPLLVIASGANRVNTQRLAELVGEPIDKPDADYVRDQTGYVIGGVPPVGHRQPITTFIDEDLCPFETIWAAAGTPRAVFCLSPGDLEKMTGGRVIKVT
jgi:prolyl-tRNA editing enzyme YbaK/EbsC (Cys-tRNA(Pro) deacylase)